MNRSFWSGAATWLLLSAAVFTAACSDTNLGVDPDLPGDGQANVSIVVPLGAITVGQLAVEVSAPDMETLYFNLEIADGTASGTLTLRTGSARTLTLRAFDHSGSETHAGSTTLNIVEGTNPAVSVTLEPLGEGDPMAGIVGDYELLPIMADWGYDPAWGGFLGHAGSTLQLRSHVVNASGDTLDVPIHWAGPGITSEGLVTPEEWTGPPTMIVTATAIAGTQARQADVVFQRWAAIEPAAMLDGGVRETCGVSQDGGLRCWGRDVLAPASIAPDRSFQSVSTGSSHACAVATDGSIWCWGNNLSGQLGDGTYDYSDVPVRVASDLTFTDVAVGISQAQYSCGLTDTGDVWCWGYNGLGQLGDGTFENSIVPVRAASDQVFRSLDIGFAHTCAITTADDAYCWGNNFNGKVGDGTFENVNAPSPVAGGHKFATVSTGTQITCGLTTAAELYCWGGGDAWFEGSLEPLLLATTQEFAQVSVGSNNPHHVCATTTAGEAYCWGLNSAGQLGDGSTVNATAPVLVSGGLTFREVVTGGNHSCGITTTDEVHCWGGNEQGQLGDLSRDDRPVPVQVAEPTP